MRSNLRHTSTLILALMALTMSCGDGSNDDITPKDPKSDIKSCLLNTCTTSGTVVRLSYSSNSLPAKIEFDYPANTEDVTSVIEYDQKGNVSKMSQINGYIEYEYNQNNKVTASHSYYRKDASSDWQKPLNVRYTYNHLGLMDSLIRDTNQYFRYEYDADNNITKEYFKYDKPETLISENIGFDDKKPTGVLNYQMFLFAIGGESLTVVKLIGLHLPAPGPHNPLISKTYYTSSSTSDTYNLKYAYNEAGYPTSATSTVGSTVYTTIFDYTCQ